MFRKKKIKFAIELVISRLTDVSLLNARLFAKVRLLDHGSFVAITESKELRGHTCLLYNPPDPLMIENDQENRPTTSERVEEDPLYILSENHAENQPFRFLLRIPYNSETLELEECRCKISIRKVERANRVPTKLGFVIVDLSQFANSGLIPISKSYLLDGYTGRQRQDNSRVHIAVRMVNQMADPLIKIPNQNWSSMDELQLNPIDRKASARAEDEVRRRCLEETDRLVHTSGTCSTQIPQSATLNSFSSSGSEGSSGTNKNSISHFSHSPPLHSDQSAISQTPTNVRFSVPIPSSSSDSRRVSAPVERASWTNGTTVDFGTPTQSSNHGQGISRRLSDHQIAVASNAPPNVPNRIQQSLIRSTRRDADSVIEEVLAEAAVGLGTHEEVDEYQHEETPDSDASITEKAEDCVDGGKRRLELYVSKKNGDALLMESASGTTAGDRRSPRHFERVRLDPTLIG